jgi:CRP-like cAMP-binding protein
MAIRSSSPSLADAFSDSPVLTYSKNQLLIHADDFPSGIFFVKDGFVKKTALLENGREITLRVYKPGDFFPLIWAFTDIDNFYYTTVTDVTLQKIPKETFTDFTEQHPSVLKELIKTILMSEYELMTSIIHQLSGDSYHRVVASLVLCANRFGVKKTPDTLSIVLPLTHQDLASITGLTRETVSLAMQKLKKKKIISMRNHATLVIKNFDALKQESLVAEGT